MKLARFVSRSIGEQPNIPGNVSQLPPTFRTQASCPNTLHRVIFRRIDVAKITGVPEKIKICEYAYFMSQLNRNFLNRDVNFTKIKYSLSRKIHFKLNKKYCEYFLFETPYM